MYIIMYKYSALKINRKSFPNNIKNPIAPAQRISTEYMRTGYFVRWEELEYLSR